jgi:hypothetical protein
MDAEQIDRILSGNRITDKAFRGVFAADELPTFVHKNIDSVYVCNTDPHDRSGEHWIVIYVDGRGYGEFFDSFGRNRLGASFEKFLRKNCVYVKRNNRMLQDLFSNACGCYCIFYAVYRCLGYNVDDIACMFTGNNKHNDEIVIDFTYNLAKCV